MNNKFNCPDCQSQFATSRTFSKHVQKKHKGSYSTISRAVKRGNSEIDDNENAFSVLVKHHKLCKRRIDFSVDSPVTPPTSAQFFIGEHPLWAVTQQILHCS